MNRSLHRRLMIYVGIATLTTFLVTACVLDVLIEESLWSEFDGALQDRLLNLTQLVEQKPHGIDFEWEDEEPTPKPMFAEGEVVTAWRESKVISVFPPGAQSLPLPANWGMIHAVTIHGDEKAREAVVSFQPKLDLDDEDRDGEEPNELPEFTTSQSITLAVARSTQRIDEAIIRLRVTLLLTAIIGSLTSLAITYLAVDYGLKPIGSTTQQLAKLDATSMRERIADEPHHAAELQPLVHTINSLLDRLQQTLERERSFTADVAHELRTPLAGLRAKLEVALSRPRESTEYVRTLTACQEITDQTAAIVESLLATTASNRKTLQASLGPVNATPLLQSLVDARQSELANRNLAVRRDVPDDLVCIATTPTLQIVFRNLFDNAISYADKDSTIHIRGIDSATTTTIEFINSTENFKQSDITSVFDRLWRSDEGRASTGVHSGLGLSICKYTVESLNGSISAIHEDDHFIVRIDLPA